MQKDSSIRTIKRNGNWAATTPCQYPGCNVVLTVNSMATEDAAVIFVRTKRGAHMFLNHRKRRSRR